jgi:hypothetical protein
MMAIYPSASPIRPMARKRGKNKGIIGLVADESPRARLTKLCRTCGRPLDDYARFCDKCGSVQPLQPPPQVQYQYAQPSQPSPESQYQYLQPPPTTLVSREPAQLQPAPVAPAAMPVSGTIQQEYLTARAPALSRPAVKVGRRTFRPLGRNLNYLGILGAILAFASLTMPWWNMTAIIPIMGLGNSTAIDFPLYLYSTSANIIVNPSTQVVSLDLWFCWVTLSLVTSAGILAIVGSTVIGKGNRILLVGGVVGLLSIVIFAIGLQTELSALGSGLDLFTMASGPWGMLTAYLSYGFWGALVAAVTMLVAATRGGVRRTAPQAAIESHAPEVAPIRTSTAEATRDVEPVAARMGRPRSIKFLIAYCILLGICALAIIPFVSSFVDAFRQLPLSAVGIALPDPTYLWGLLTFSAFVDFVIAFGLLKRMKRARIITRVLSVAAVVFALIMICLVAVLLVSPNLLGVQTETTVTDSGANVLYGVLAASAVLGVVLPLVVFRYLSRPNVKEYFGIAE